MNLAGQLLKLKTSEQLRSTTATVTNLSPFIVTLGDGVEIVSPPRLASYTPTLHDVVLVLRPDTGFLVVDAIV